MTRFFGEWNCAQSRASANSLSARAAPMTSTRDVSMGRPNATENGQFYPCVWVVCDGVESSLPRSTRQRSEGPVFKSRARSGYCVLVVLPDGQGATFPWPSSFVHDTDTNAAIARALVVYGGADCIDDTLLLRFPQCLCRHLAEPRGVPQCTGRGVRTASAGPVRRAMPTTCARHSNSNPRSGRGTSGHEGI